MAFFNKMGSLLRQSVSANNSLNEKLSMGPMFNAIRCMSSAKISVRSWRSSLQKEDLEKAKKSGAMKVCLGSSIAEQNRIKRNLYHFKSLLSSKRRNAPRSASSIVDNFVFYRSTYCSAVSAHEKILRSRRRIIKKIDLPTHYVEVNYRTRKAVVFYGPSVNHIPHGIKAKDMNLLL